MVKKQVIWPSIAKNDLLSILDYYYKRNGNKVYSGKLYKKFQKNVSLISKISFLGKPTDIPHVRIITINEYLLFYKVSAKEIIILTIWDSRRNPDNLNINS